MHGLLRRAPLCQFRSLVRAMSSATEVAPAVKETQETTPKRGRKRKHSDPEDDNGADGRPDREEIPKRGFFEPQESEYYFQNGLRKVYPYYFRYITFAKGRWIGRTLIDIFSTEFRARPKEYYEQAIKSGQIKIQGNVVDENYRMKETDRISNDSHRHEVPVIGCPIKIIHEDEEMLVVDKPPSIPCHPCGRYRLNSILSILAREHGLKNLHTLHRLDRLTSGVLMFAKTKERSQFMDSQMKNRNVQKQYLCRVAGEFPDGEVVVDKPIEVFSFKLGVCGVGEKGRDSETRFEKLSYNGKSSVVLAKPKQGRMHQIRVHLQYLGHPIVNDPLYNDEAFGTDKAKGGLTQKTPTELVEELILKHNLENWSDPASEEEVKERRTAFENIDHDNISQTPVSSTAEDFFKNYPKNLEHYITDDFRKTLRGFDPRKMQFEESCPECKLRFVDPPPSKLVMYLHCYSYKGENFEYTATWPNWAKEDWDLD